MIFSLGRRTATLMLLLPLLVTLFAADPSASVGEPSITLGDDSTASVVGSQPPMTSTAEAVSSGAIEQEGDARFGAGEAAAGEGDPQQIESMQSEPPRLVRQRQFPHHWIEVPFRAGRNVVGVGIGAMVFPSPYLGVGAVVMDTQVFGRGSNNHVQILPKARFMLLPFRKVSPYLCGAMGLAVFNRGLGAYANWMLGTGLMIRAGQRAVLDFGIDAHGLLPADRFARRFECSDTTGPCSLILVPRAGLIIRLGAA